MTRKLLIHVGSPKCGSTYLQCAMVENRALLNRHGFEYPEPKSGHPGNAGDLWRTGVEQIEGMFGKYQGIVLSHEDLFARAGAMAGLAARCQELGIDVRIIAFIRPFSDFIFADYSQHIKQYISNFIAAGSAFDGRSFEEFAADRQKDLIHLQCLKAWQKQFPENPIVVASHREIVPTMERLLGLGGLDWTVPRSATNPSLRMIDCDEICLAINSKRMSQAAIMDMYRSALQKTELFNAAATTERVAWLEALFRRVNMQLKSEFDVSNAKERKGPGR